MDSIRIRWTGGEATFQPGTVVHIGRELDAQVQPANTNVSRRHAEVSHTPSGWVLRDVGSAQGTWKDGRQVDAIDVRGTVRVTLGREGRGEVLTLEASASAPQAAEGTELPGRGLDLGSTEIVGAGTPGRGAVASSSDGTVIVGADGAVTPSGQHRPGGQLRDDAVGAATVVTGETITVLAGGERHTFGPGKDITIGRDGDCDVVVSNPTVSRRHASITHDGTTWGIRDDGSSSGTTVNGSRITAVALAPGRTSVLLGDPASGETIDVTVGGEPSAARRVKVSRPGSPRVPVLLGAGLIALLVVAAGWFLVNSVLGGSTSNDDLELATVQLDTGDGTGSGSIIDASKGLILTNAHVAAPSAPGSAVREVTPDIALDDDPDQILVNVVPAPGKDAEPRFVAEVVAVDGYLDLAVLQIVETVGGRLVEPDSGDLDGLRQVSIGDSRTLSTGDDVRVFGYPGAAQSSSVTLTEGVVSGQVKDRRLDSNRAMLNISADISGGNSGGLAVDDAGRLIGVPTLVRGGEVSSMRPSEFAEPLIEAAREGEQYESPWIRPLEAEAIDSVRIVEPGSAPGIEFECSTGSFETAAVGEVGVAFNYSGFTPGEHQDLMVEFYAESTLGIWALNFDYPVNWPEESGCATVTVPIDLDVLAKSSGDLEVLIGLGPSYRTS